MSLHNSTDLENQLLDFSQVSQKPQGTKSKPSEAGLIWRGETKTQERI